MFGVRAFHVKATRGNLPTTFGLVPDTRYLERVTVWNSSPLLLQLYSEHMPRPQQPCYLRLRKTCSPFNSLFRRLPLF